MTAQEVTGERPAPQAVPAAGEGRCLMNGRTLLEWALVATFAIFAVLAIAFFSWIMFAGAAMTVVLLAVVNVKMA
jgi:hypothetical protein